VLIADVNVLLSAHRVDLPAHARLRRWVTDHLGGDEPFGVSELVLSSVVRIATNHRVFAPPATVDEVLQFCDAIRAAPASVLVSPGPRHWDLFAGLCRSAQARANIVSDAYLAALAVEQGATFVTLDRGFARFAGLRLLDPLA
jgi:toxin-antitoxin system PIN domain toxin